MSIFLLLFVLVFALGWAYHTELWMFAIWLWLFLIHGWLAHPWQTTAYFSGYFIAGAWWSVIKWWFHETAKVRRLKQDKHLSGRAYTAEEMAERLRRGKTNVLNHKSDIYFWIGFWPVNMIWTLIDDPFRRLVHRIADELQGVYQRITDHVWQ